MKKARDENYKYLVIEASFGEYFGFNMKVKKQQAIAIKSEWTWRFYGSGMESFKDTSQMGSQLR